MEVVVLLDSIRVISPCPFISIPPPSNHSTPNDLLLANLNLSINFHYRSPFLLELLVAFQLQSSKVCAPTFKETERDGVLKIATKNEESPSAVSIVYYSSLVLVFFFFGIGGDTTNKKEALEPDTRIILMSLFRPRLFYLFPSSPFPFFVTATRVSWCATGA